MPDVSGRIFVAEDDDVFRSRLSDALTERGYEVIQANDVSNAKEAIASRDFALSVVDLRMPGGSGLDIVKEIRQVHPNARILVLTGYGSIATATEAMRLGATNYLPKPADVDEILNAFFPENPSSEKSEKTKSDETSPSLARMEWEHINRVLQDCDGNISEAARRLGLHRRSLQRKLQKFPPKQ